MMVIAKVIAKFKNKDNLTLMEKNKNNIFG